MLRLPLVTLSLLVASAVACGCVAPGRRARSGAGDPAPARAIPGADRPATGALRPGELDALLDASWRAAGVTPAPAAGDGEYLRRVTLDLLGRVPTLAEARAFLGDTGPDRRARLVDRLLASPEFARHFAGVYADLFFGVDARGRVDKVYAPRDYLERVFAENRPYDRLAHDLLTATGNSEENPALGFIATRLQGGGGVEAVAGAAARVFLGLQIQCAQCHDHPYDTRWKQEDFYGLVAYFAQTRARRDKAMDMQAGRQVVTLTDVRRGQARMRRPGSEVDVPVGRRFLGAALEPRAHESPRQALARGIVASDLFAKAMVARTWAQLFGRAPVEPWDDLGGEDDPAHPPVLVRLSEDFRAGGFDVKRLVRTIVLGAAYGRSADAAPGAPDDGGKAVRAFARAALRPLSPDQLFGTLVTATGVAQAGRQGGRDEVSERRLAQAFREYRFAFADDDEMASTDGFDGSVPQALLLLNGELTNGGVRAARGGTLDAVLGAEASAAARLEALFLAVYTRLPTEEERRALLPAVDGRTRRGRASREDWEDLFFALLTSTEALTNH